MVDIDAARQIGKTIPAAARPDFPPAAAPSKPVRTLGVRHAPRSSQRPSRRCTRTRAGRLARSAARIHRPARYDVGPRAGCDRWGRSGPVTGGRVTGCDKCERRGLRTGADWAPRSRGSSCPFRECGMTERAVCSLFSSPSSSSLPRPRLAAYTRLGVGAPAPAPPSLPPCRSPATSATARTATTTRTR